MNGSANFHTTNAEADSLGISRRSLPQHAAGAKGAGEVSFQTCYSLPSSTFLYDATFIFSKIILVIYVIIIPRALFPGRGVALRFKYCFCAVLGYTSWTFKL